MLSPHLFLQPRRTWVDGFTSRPPGGPRVRDIVMEQRSGTGGLQATAATFLETIPGRGPSRDCPRAPATGVFLCVVLVLGSLAACSKKQDDLCDRTLSHLTSLMDGGAQREMGTVEKAIYGLVTSGSVAQCRSEGLSQAQADCILTAKTRDQFMALGECEAIQAKKPSWLLLPPSQAEMEMIRKKMQPPDGPQETPVRYKAIAGSGGSVCGLRDDGSLQCWGSQERVLSGTVSSLSWDRHLCGLRMDGTLTCAMSTRGDDLAYLPKEPLSDFSEGRFHGCGIRAKDGSLTCWSQEPDDAVTPPQGAFTEVVSGLHYSCARASGGVVKCFGKEAPPQVPQSQFEALSGGLSHVCGIRKDGSLECFGQNVEGVTEPPAGKYKKVSCGNWHCCAIAEDNSLACWGKNSSGEATAPTGTFTVVEASVNFSCGVRESGTVCWGMNHMGQTNVPQRDDGEHHWFIPGR